MARFRGELVPRRARVASRRTLGAALRLSLDDDGNGLHRLREPGEQPLRPLLAVPTLSEAPPVEAAGVFPRSLGRHSYIRLTPSQFAAARKAIAAVAGSQSTA